MTAPACRRIATAELGRVARRIYQQSIDGRNVRSSVRRLERSAALAAAVAHGDPRATAAAARPLLLHQIVRLRIFRGRHELFAAGSAPSFAPIAGLLHDAAGHPVGHFVLAVSDDRAFAGLTERLTGAQVYVSARGHRRFGVLGRGPVARTVLIRARAFPAGPLQIAVRIPAAPAPPCGSDAAETRLNAIGFVARRLMAAESHSRSVSATLRYAEHDPAFRAAVAARDRVAIRAAIIGFFRVHRFHIVRVRVWDDASRLLLDVGGPYVLAPASGPVRGPDGRVAGHFSLAVQDDTGYIKLLHRFTGAAVQLSTAAGPVPGSTLSPGPHAIPAHGPVVYAGRRYLADSFDGPAFPDGLLHVSVLMPVAP